MNTSKLRVPFLYLYLLMTQIVYHGACFKLLVNAIEDITFYNNSIHSSLSPFLPPYPSVAEVLFLHCTFFLEGPMGYHGRLYARKG